LNTTDLNFHYLDLSAYEYRNHKYLSANHLDEKLPAITCIIANTVVNGQTGRAFVDCGCTFNAIADAYARKCQLNITDYPNDLVCTIGGDRTMTVKRRVVRVLFDLGETGIADCYAFVFEKLPWGCDVLFGMDLLRLVNPVINWQTGELSKAEQDKEIKQIDTTRDKVDAVSKPVPVNEKPPDPARYIQAEHKFHEMSYMYMDKAYESETSDEFSTKVMGADEFRRELASLDPDSPDEFFFVVTPTDNSGKVQRYTEQGWELLRENPAYLVLKKYKDTVFKEKLSAKDVPQHGEIKHSIDLRDSKPVNVKQFRLSPEQQTAVNNWVNEMLQAGLIRPSTSPYSSPIFCVKKPVGWRIVHDYRVLNSKTNIPKQPIPRKDSIIDSMYGGFWFSCMDLLSGYYQLLLEENSRQFTAFSTPNGHFEYLVTAQGLAGAPASFNRFIQHVFEDLQEFSRAFFDDIYVFTKSTDVNVHLDALDRVLKRCEERGLSIKLSKCVFVKEEIPVLGDFVGRSGVRMDPDKVAVIKSWPTPRTKTQLKSFLGTIVYCSRFCENYGNLVAPLHAATQGKKKHEKIELSRDQLTSFLKLKLAMCHTPVLALPDFTNRFGIRMDASDFAIGGVLFQVDGNGVEHPIAYAGRKLTGSEMNYPVREKELLAIIFALKTWRPYLLDQPFSVETDHQTLQELLTQSTCTQRLARWLDFISEYRPEFKWIPGNTNDTADGISRRHDFMSRDRPASKVDLPQLLRSILARTKNDGVNDCDDGKLYFMDFNNYEFAMMTFQLLQTSDIYELCRKYYKHDKNFEPVWTFLQGGQEDTLGRFPHFSLHNDLLWYSKDGEAKRLCIPEFPELKRRILFSEHDDVVRGHPGSFKTIQFVKEKYYWKNLDKFVKHYVSTCEKCQRNKHRQSKPPGLLHPLPVPEARWQHITMDFMTGLPISDGFNAIWVIIDRLTKRAHFLPVLMKNEGSDAPACAKLFRRDYQRLHGLPETIISDRDSRFNSSFWKSLMEMQGVKHVMSSAFRPNTDGQTERVNRFISDYLRNYIYPCQDNWVELLPFAEIAYNSRFHDAIKMSPFEADLGYIPRTIHDHVFDRLVGSKSKRDIMELGQRQQVTLDRLKKHLIDAQARMKLYYDLNRPVQSFAIGDKVLISSKNLDIQHLGVISSGSTKLAPLWIGPYEVLAKTSIDTYKLQLPIGLRLHDEFHTSLLKPYVFDSDPDRLNVPNEGMIQAGGESGAFLIEDVRGHKKVKGKIHYLVKWLGYPAEFNTWEPLQNILKPAGGLINNYLNRIKLDKNVWNPPVRRLIRKGKTKR
jgi:transposase InsO family protein